MSDVSALFEVLRAEPRRQLLVTLCDVASVRVPDDVFTRAAVRTASSADHQPRQDHSSDGATARDLQMYHNHLPKLETEGIIEWDRETGTVSRGPAFGEIEPAIRLLITNQHALPGLFV